MIKFDITFNLTVNLGHTFIIFFVKSIKLCEFIYFSLYKSIKKNLGHVKGWVTEGHAHGQGHQGQDLEPQGHGHLHQGKSLSRLRLLNGLKKNCIAFRFWHPMKW